MPALSIAMLTTFYPPYNFGGDGIGVMRLATALSDHGCKVTVIHDKDAYLTLSGAEPKPIAADSRIEVIGLKSALGPASSLLTQQTGYPVAHHAALKRLLDDGHFDIIWYNNISLVGGPGLLAYGSAIKIYEAHEHWLVCPTHVLWRYNRELCDAKRCLSCVVSYRRPPQLWRYTGLLERNLGHVDVFIAKSAFSREMHRKFGFAPDMRVIPYFLPDEPPAESGDPPQTKPYFLFVGRLEKIKGVQDIIPAFSGSDGPELIVIGSGDYEAELHRFAAGHPRVRFLGRLPPAALTAWYRHARALIVPSICYETFGIILIEAFRGATPVIARRIGPFPEIVARGGGVLFDDESELRAAITRLAGDTAARDRLASDARVAFTTNWREDVVIPAYLNLIRDVAAVRGNTRVVAAVGA